MVTALVLSLAFVSDASAASAPTAEAAVTLSSTSSTSSSSSLSRLSSPSAATVAAYEARVIYATNVQRVKYRRAKLVPASCPDRYAEGWAAYLSRTGLFYHRSMRVILNSCRATRVAENIARGALSADRMVAAWMASPGHRANILDGRLQKVGVGAVYLRGRWTVVQDFIRS
jgi:uncharacterized protein YkwD